MRLRSREALVELIEEAEISEREVARRAGLGHSTVNHLLTGRRRSCSVITALAIERVFLLRPGTLFLPESQAEETLIGQYTRSLRLARAGRRR
jgi:transcriptional regulator with XRE-family HTH domain